MTQSATHNDRFPTGPAILLLLILILAATAVGKLTPEQMVTLGSVVGLMASAIGLITALIPYLPRGGR